MQHMLDQHRVALQLNGLIGMHASAVQLARGPPFDQLKPDDSLEKTTWTASGYLRVVC